MFCFYISSRLLKQMPQRQAVKLVKRNMKENPKPTERFFLSNQKTLKKKSKETWRENSILRLYLKKAQIFIVKVLPLNQTFNAFFFDSTELSRKTHRFVPARLLSREISPRLREERSWHLPISLEPATWPASCLCLTGRLQLKQPSVMAAGRRLTGLAGESRSRKSLDP